jgi:L-seryl-tRNA(Ser) seleniumtransferase
MDIYDKLGVRKVINAWGTVTAVGGSLMPQEAYQAMAEAGRSFVFLDELHQKAGQYIAGLLGVEAAYISSGAAGGLVLAAAACLTGTDQQRIWALPNTEGWKNEIIVQQEKGPSYIHQAMQHTGAKLVQVGAPEEMTVADIEAGLSENTAAIMLYLGIRRQPPISAVALVARRAGVPIIVDAAAELPPRRNLTEPLAQGADLVVFSGGKGIRGPQATGLILGQKELVQACRLNSNPHSAIGRPMKVGKEDIAALIAALEVFMAQDEEAEIAEYKRRADDIVQALEGVGHIEARTLMADPRGRPLIPRVYVDFKEGFRLTGREVQRRMLAGELPVAIGEGERGIRVDVMLLEDWQVRAVARKLREVLSAVGG